MYPYITLRITRLDRPRDLPISGVLVTLRQKSPHWEYPRNCYAARTNDAGRIERWYEAAESGVTPEPITVEPDPSTIWILMIDLRGYVPEGDPLSTINVALDKRKAPSNHVQLVLSAFSTSYSVSFGERRNPGMRV
jgi:hypothetical protein